MDRANLAGQTILVVEEQPLIALDLQDSVGGSGRRSVVARNAAEALGRMGQFDFTAGVIDWRPASEDHRVVARALKQRKVRFLFYATNPPEDVTTVRGAPTFLKPASPR